MTYTSGLGHCPRAAGFSGLGRLDAGGGTEAGFGARGAVRRWSDDMVALPGGGIATVGYETPWYYGREAARVGITRLSPDGRPDRGFGTRGRAVVETPGGSGGLLDSIAADRRGRLLLGGTMTTVRGRRGAATGGKVRRQRLFVLMRVTAGGRLDRAFGPGGRVAARFGARNVTESEVLLDSQGRAVVVGTYGRYGHQGVAVARYALTR